MDKILQSMRDQGSHTAGQIQITNDGATILRSVHIDNAAAKVLVDISKTQDEEIGDGTTSVAVLCGEMLREAEKLIEARIHPQTIVNGWGNLDHIHVLKKPGGSMRDSYLADGFIIDKR